MLVVALTIVYMCPVLAFWSLAGACAASFLLVVAIMLAIFGYVKPLDVIHDTLTEFSKFRKYTEVVVILSAICPTAKEKPNGA